MVLNISVFLVIAVMQLILFLLGSDKELVMLIISKVSVKSNLSILVQQPWSFISYMFVHEGFFHILFNMLILYWSGKLFCDYFSSSKVVAVYVLGGIAGALLYIISYNLFPAFSDAREFSQLIGASAGVIAVLVAISTLLPNYSIHLLIFGAVKLKFIAIFLVVLYAISIPNGNAGGNISHLGGALFGFIYTRTLQSGIDIGMWFEKIAKFIMQMFKPASRIKVVHRKQTGTKKTSGTRQDVIDAILDKISRSGYSSLTNEERDILFKASKSDDKNQ